LIVAWPKFSSLEAGEQSFPSPPVLTPCSGNGFIGVPTIKGLVANGYTVEATVRSEAKAAQTNAILTPDEARKTTFRIIPDITPDGAFDELIKAGSYDAVVHTAGPFTFSL
jgi:nucleoside-diphosphate-sugar epimerase